MNIQIPNGFTPRDYQLPFMRYLDNHAKGGRAVWVVHRRGGKDLTAMHQTCKMMHLHKGTYWHVYPTSEQARRSIWTEFTKDGQRIMEQVFPAPIRKHPKDFAPNAEMIVELKCGSIWRLMGSDRMEVVGAGPVGVVFSEFAVAKPAAWDFVRPMLREREGWAAFISTPRGRNHFHEMWEVAGREAGWWRDLKTLYDTKAYDPDATIEAERREGMTESRIRQEYLCDWTAANVGSVWGDLVERLENQQRICEFPHTSKAVYTSWDIGVDDSTAIWFWQINSERSVDVIDYYENHGKPVSHYLDELDRRDYEYVRHWLPHDARARTFQTGASTLEMMIEACGGDKVAITPQLSIPDGLQAGRWMLQQPMRIHTRCGEGLDAIREYHYAWDEDRKTFSTKPEHDWSSHGADAFRYLSLVVKFTELVTRKKPAKVSPPAVPMDKSFTLDGLFKDRERYRRF